MNDPDWKPQAACRRHPEEWWYPPDQARGLARRAWVQRAQAICRTCPVVQHCAQTALDGDERHGIWAGVDFHGGGTNQPLQRATQQLQAIAAGLTTTPPPVKMTRPEKPTPCAGGCGNIVICRSHLQPGMVERHGQGMCAACYMKHYRCTTMPGGRNELWERRRDTVAQMTRAGHSIAEIAARLGVTTRAVSRARAYLRRQQDAS